MTNRFKLREGGSISRCPKIENFGNLEIYDRDLPSGSPVKSVKIYLIGDFDANMICSGISCKPEYKDEDFYILDLSEKVIGDYFLEGVCANSVEEYERFLAEIKIGNVNLGVVNIEKAMFGEKLIETFIALCLDIQVPCVHIFVKDIEFIKDINKKMKTYFIKSDGHMIKD